MSKSPSRALLVVASAVSLAGSAANAEFTVPFVDLCGVGSHACTGEVLLTQLMGPDPGTTIYGTTVEITWTTDGTRDASTLGFRLGYVIDGETRTEYVTGTDLGFTTPGAGTFHGVITTDVFNGVVSGGLPGFPSFISFELIPDPQCEPAPNDSICGIWGTFENNTGQGTFSGLIFDTDPPTEPCPVDWNADGTVDIFDLLAYLDDWFMGDPAAELDLSDGITVFDLLTYLTGWFEVSGGAPCL